jgi:hypothetical protein
VVGLLFIFPLSLWPLYSRPVIFKIVVLTQRLFVLKRIEKEKENRKKRTERNKERETT